MAQSANLYKVKSTYYFRVRIPKDLQGWFPQYDIKRSLRTKSLTSARRLVMLWAAKTEKVFTTIRAGLLAGIMTGKQIRKLVEDYIRFTLKQDDEERLREGVKETTIDTPEGEVTIPERVQFDPVREAVKEDFERNRYDIVSLKLDKFLASQGLEVDKESYEYQVLCRDITQVYINEIHQINVDRDMGSFDDKYYQSDGELEEVDKEQSESSPPEVGGLLLSELTTKYLAEKEARGKQSKGTYDANKRYFALFHELLGDVPVEAVTRDQLVECLNKMKRLPSRREIMPEYKGKTIAELLQLENVKNPLGAQTIKNHISTLSS